MSIKELVHDEALLSTPCEKATAADAEVAQDLLDTMASLDDAACLHANQIGVTHDLFAYVDEKDKPHVMFNPMMKRALGAFKVQPRHQAGVGGKQAGRRLLHPRRARHRHALRPHQGCVRGAGRWQAGRTQGRFPRLGGAAYPAHGRPRQRQVHLSSKRARKRNAFELVSFSAQFVLSCSDGTEGRPSKE